MKRRSFLLLGVAALAGLLLLTRPYKTAHREFNHNELLMEHNKGRRKSGLKDLKNNEVLREYAQNHAEKMARKSDMFHSNMNELSKFAGCPNVAENVAWGQDSESEVTKAWMNSPGHKKNILGDYDSIGFGMAKDRKGNSYWCAVFCKKEKNG